MEMLITLYLIYPYSCTIKREIITNISQLLWKTEVYIIHKKSGFTLTRTFTYTTEGTYCAIPNLVQMEE